MMTHLAAAHLDDDQTLDLLRSSRLARVAFSVNGEPIVVAATVAVGADGRVVLTTDNVDAREHLAGQHVAVEVDGRFPATGASWYVVVHGTATAGADRDATSAWGGPESMRTFVVVPASMDGQVLGHTETDRWFAGVPAS